MRTLRRDALEKLAALSSTSAVAGKQSDITSFCRRCPGPRGASRVPMGLPEMEALLALCKAAPLVTNFEIAAQLLAQLTRYLPESQEQTLNVPPSASDGPEAPWEALTYNLTTAILSLGLNHPSL